jgi:CubicO group peptidase (beta-lactamase class C family)
VSKQFTAMTIMMVKEKGLLHYDDLVEKYINIPYKGMTIRQLLTHTSGLPDYQAIMDSYWDKSKVAGNDDIINYLNKYAPPKLFEPGEKYLYSNTGYVLLASILEKVSGRDFIEFCNTEIFNKLKMNHTAIRSLAEKATIKNFALGHVFVPERNAYIRADSFPSSNYTIWLGNRKGPGRISSTAEDLLKWDQALYTNKLVSQTTLAEAFTPMRLNNGGISNYGFGWELRLGENIVWHNGDNPGYKTIIIRFLKSNITLQLSSKFNERLSTGYYLPAGVQMTVNVIQGSSNGWTCKIGAHTDILHDTSEYTRWPMCFVEKNMSQRKSLKFKSPFGGLLYFDW